MIYKIKHYLIYRVIRKLLGNNISAKKIYKTDKILYHRRSDHLNFLFKKTIKYELEVQEYLAKRIKKNFIVFDIVANIGQYSIFLSDLVGPKGSIYSFEPDSNSFEFLKKNIIENNCNNISYEKLAFGKKEANQKLFNDSLSGGRKSSFDKSLVGNNYIGTNEIVEVKTLDSQIDKYGLPNFIKIDSEGYEVQILKGLKKDFTKKTFFMIEVRDQTKNFVFNYFNRRGYSAFDVTTNKIVSDSSHIHGTTNLFFK